MVSYSLLTLKTCDYEITLDKELADNCLVVTHTKLELTLVVDGYFRIVCTCTQCALISCKIPVLFKMVYEMVLDHGDQQTAVQCASAYGSTFRHCACV